MSASTADGEIGIGARRGGNPSERSSIVRVGDTEIERHITTASIDVSGGVGDGGVRSTVHIGADDSGGFAVSAKTERPGRTKRHGLSIIGGQEGPRAELTGQNGSIAAYCRSDECPGIDVRTADRNGWLVPKFSIGPLQQTNGRRRERADPDLELLSISLIDMDGNVWWRPAPK